MFGDTLSWNPMKKVAKELFATSLEKGVCGPVIKPAESVRSVID